MKLPFFNRRRYVEIKAYTNSKRALTEVPLCFTKDVKNNEIKSISIPKSERKYTRTFNTCYGRIAALRNSITLRTWSEFDITTSKDSVQFKWPKGNHFMNIVMNKDDAFRPDNLHVAKVMPPWRLECSSPGINVVNCSHILNTSHLHIASGIAPISNPTLNFFTYLPKREDTYSIPYKMPILQMFPLTDLPIKLECSFDLHKWAEIETMCNSKPYFRYSKKII
jgi:hypothetical protein